MDLDTNLPSPSTLLSENQALKAEIATLKSEIESLKLKLEINAGIQGPLPTIAKKLTHTTKQRVPRPGQQVEEEKDVVMLPTSPLSFPPSENPPIPVAKVEEFPSPRKSEVKPVGGVNIFGGFDPTKTRLRSSTTGGSRPVMGAVPPPSQAPILQRRSTAVKEASELDAEKILKWVKIKTQEEVDKEALKDGVVLCKLLNALTGVENLKPKTGKSTFVYKVWKFIDFRYLCCV